MKALARLEVIGYQVSLEGDEIRLCYREERDPDPAVVIPLLNLVKSHKSEAVGFLRAREKADAQFRKALNEVKKEWLPGLLRHIEKNHSDLWEQIRQAQDALEGAWAEVLAGKTTLLDAFEGALERWASLHRQAIHEHSRQTCRESAAFPLGCT